MFPQPQRPEYRGGLNETLLGAVPDDALTVLETGCAEGLLGARLKELVPGRTVIGVEIDEAAAEAARELLDEVHVVDLMAGPPPVEPGTVDAILFGDVLEHLVDPEAVLVHMRELLAPGGRIIASIPNMTHHSMLKPFLRSDLMYQPIGLLDATHLRWFSYATIWKLFLDAGYEPRIVDTIQAPISDEALNALTPELMRHRVHPHRAKRHLDVYQYVVEAVPLPAPPSGFAAPISFAVLVNDPPQLKANLKSSPIFEPGSPHELIELPGMTSAAAGLASALEQAQHDLVVLVQQDIYLPRGWDHTFRAEWDRASQELGPLGMAGVFGVRYRDGGEPIDAGRIIDRDRLLTSPLDLPGRVDSLDEVLLAMPRDTPLVADPDLGWHLYGSDLALQAADLDLPVVVLDALCFHNSLFGHAGADYHLSRERLLAKWESKRPLRSNFGELDTMRVAPPVIPWHVQQRRDLQQARDRVGRQRDRVRKLEAKLADSQSALRDERRAAKRAKANAAGLRKELKQIRSSRTWRARGKLARVLRRG